MQKSEAIGGKLEKPIGFRLLVWSWMVLIDDDGCLFHFIVVEGGSEDDGDDSVLAQPLAPHFVLLRLDYGKRLHSRDESEH